MKRKLKSKKINELIIDFLELSKKSNVTKNINILHVWRCVVGKQVALETKEIRVKEGILFITISNPYLKADLISQKDLIIHKIKPFEKSIKKLIFN